MGFGSAFISQEIIDTKWPSWLIEKYKYTSFGDTEDGVTYGGTISSKCSIKLYTGSPTSFPSLLKDIQKCIDWENWDKFATRSLSFIIIHDGCGITKVVLNKNDIIILEPDWKDEAFEEIDNIEKSFHLNGCT